MNDATIRKGLRKKDFVIVAFVVGFVSVFAGIDIGLEETGIVAGFGNLFMYAFVAMFAVVAANKRHNNNSDPAKAILAGALFGILGSVGGMILLLMTCMPATEAAGYQWFGRTEAPSDTERLLIGSITALCSATIALMIFVGVYGIVVCLIKRENRSDADETTTDDES